VHGCLAPYVVHPAAFTFKLPDSVSFEEAAMVEPSPSGCKPRPRRASRRATSPWSSAPGRSARWWRWRRWPGGCSRVIISDLQQIKLDIAGQYPGITPVNIRNEKLADVVARETDGWGAESSSRPAAAPRRLRTCSRCLGPAAASCWSACRSSRSVRRVSPRRQGDPHRNVFPLRQRVRRRIAMMGSGKVDLKPLISETFRFEDSVEPSKRAAERRPGDVEAADAG
jgi:D-xylulose reductase